MPVTPKPASRYRHIFRIYGHISSKTGSFIKAFCRLFVTRSKTCVLITKNVCDDLTHSSTNMLALIKSKIVILDIIPENINYNNKIQKQNKAT